MKHNNFMCIYLNKWIFKCTKKYYYISRKERNRLEKFDCIKSQIKDRTAVKKSIVIYDA